MPDRINSICVATKGYSGAACAMQVMAVSGAVDDDGNHGGVAVELVSI